MSVTVPAIFKECHRLRRHLRDLQEAIDRGPSILKARQQQLADAEKTHKDAYETIKQLKLKQKEEESFLKSLESQLAKLFERSMTVTTLKEMEATKHETEMANAKKSACEDAILAAIMEIEERTADLPNVEKRWADAQAEFRQFEIEAREHLESMLADQKASAAKLAEWEAQLPEDVKSEYDRMIRRNGADGLAAVTNRACGHCRTQMTEDKADLLNAGRYMTCSNCGRGLYRAD